jgi:hypothetical protein
MLLTLDEAKRLRACNKTPIVTRRGLSADELLTVGPRFRGVSHASEVLARVVTQMSPLPCPPDRPLSK